MTAHKINMRHQPTKLESRWTRLKPAVSIQTQSLALRALCLDGNRAKRKRLPTLASSQS